VEASDIKKTGSSGLFLVPKIDENMEMSTSISVILSSNDTLRSKRRNMVENVPLRERTALRVGEEDISSREIKSWHVTKRNLGKLIL